MSCMIMNPEPLDAIANAAEMLLNCGYEYFGFDAPRSMHEVFQDCQTGYSYDAYGIYKKLYAVNIAAYNGRYKGHETPADCEAPTIDCSRYTVHKRPEYAEHHHAVLPWFHWFPLLLYP